jgi:hypothetical protein
MDRLQQFQADAAAARDFNEAAKMQATRVR